MHLSNQGKGKRRNGIKDVTHPDMDGVGGMCIMTNASEIIYCVALKKNGKPNLQKL